MRIGSKTIWIFLVVFLLGTNVTMVISYRNHLKKDDIDVESNIEVPNDQLGKFFRAELDLSPEQQEYFRKMRRNYNRDANQLLTWMRQIRSEMGVELQAVQPDKEQFDSLAREIGQQHVELKQLTFDYYIQLQEVLDPEQREKMVAIFQAMLNEDGNAQTPRGQRQGQRLGIGRKQAQGKGANQKQE